MNCILGGSDGMRGKTLLNENACGIDLSGFQMLSDVVTSTTLSFLCDNICQIWPISVNVFVDFGAVFVTIGGGCYNWLAYDGMSSIS